MKILKTTKLTSFKPLQDELLKLRAQNKSLIKILQDISLFMGIDNNHQPENENEEEIEIINKIKRILNNAK